MTAYGLVEVRPPHLTMIVQNNPELASQLLSEMMEHIKEDRTGQHPSITDLIDCLTKTYYNEEQGQALDYTDQTKVFFLIGIGLEKAILPRRKEQPIHGEKEGIYYHMDSIDRGLVEVKSTRSSVKNVETEFSPRWLKQVKGYLWAIDERVVDIAVVYLIPGDFRVYRVTFDQMEIKLAGDWLRHRRDVWNAAKATGQAPKAYAYNDGESKNSWECKGCQYTMVCQVRSSMGL